MAYQDDKLVSICRASSTLSNIIGGVTAFASNYFVNTFPKNYFKKVYISDNLNFRNLRYKFPKQEKPYIFIQPTFELGNTFIEQLPAWHNPTIVVFKNKKRNYRMIFNDPEHNIAIYTVPNRIKINYVVGMKFQTQMAAWNVLNYLNQNFDAGGYSYANRINLQAELPKIILVNICKILGLDYNNGTDREKLDDYLMKYSLNSITENINLSTGNPSFMYNYITNILINYPDLATSEKQYRNLIMNHAQVNFNFSCELWAPASFIVDFGCSYNDFQYNVENSTDTKFKFNLIIEKDFIPDHIDEKIRLFKRDFVPDVNVEYDNLDITNLFKPDMVKVITALKKYNVDLNKVFDVILSINGNILGKTHYRCNFNDMTLKTYTPMMNTTYRLYLYANLEILNKVNDYLNAIEKHGSVQAYKDMEHYLLNLNK